MLQQVGLIGGYIGSVDSPVRKSRRELPVQRRFGRPILASTCTRRLVAK
jgi:hypothetical protein